MTESPSPIDPGANDPDQGEEEVWGDHIDPGAAPRVQICPNADGIPTCGPASDCPHLEYGPDDATSGLPDDLAAILRDQSVVIPQHAAVFEAMAKYVNVPSNTPSAPDPEYVKGFVDGYRAGSKPILDERDVT